MNNAKQVQAQTKQVQARLSGRVQGVGFRYFACHAAQGLGIVGTVRNTEDGIDVVAEGDETKLHEFLVALRRGPQHAEVTGMTVAWSEPDGVFAEFAAVA